MGVGLRGARRRVPLRLSLSFHPTSLVVAPTLRTRHQTAASVSLPPPSSAPSRGAPPLSSLALVSYDTSTAPDRLPFLEPLVATSADSPPDAALTRTARAAPAFDACDEMHSKLEGACASHRGPQGGMANERGGLGAGAGFEAREGSGGGSRFGYLRPWPTCLVAYASVNITFRLASPSSLRSVSRGAPAFLARSRILRQLHRARPPTLALASSPRFKLADCAVSTPGIHDLGPAPDFSCRRPLRMRQRLPPPRPIPLSSSRIELDGAAQRIPLRLSLGCPPRLRLSSLEGRPRWSRLVSSFCTVIPAPHPPRRTASSSFKLELDLTGFWEARVGRGAEPSWRSRTRSLSA